jgi:hypothetical protein
MPMSDIADVKFNVGALLCLKPYYGQQKPDKFSKQYSIIFFFVSVGI